MKNSIHIKRAKRIRRKLKKNNKDRYRLSIFRSSKNISAQIIDDKNNKTLISASSVKEKGSKKKKSELSLFVAELLAKKAQEKKFQKFILIGVNINILEESRYLQKHYVKVV